jgi:HK97 family phage major capsid protein
MTNHTRAEDFAPIELKGDDADPADIVTKALDDLQAAVDARLKDIEAKSADAAKLTARLDTMEAKLSRPAVVTDTKAASVERKAFETMLRRGEARMGAEEQKALTVASDAAGGYLAPEEVGSELIKLLRQFSPVRQYARVVSIGAESITYPRRVSSTTATWTAETADRTASEMTFEQIKLTPFELATYTDVSNQLLEDNAYNLEGELLSDYAESFGKAEGAAFVSGTGVAQPKGILAAAGIAEVKTGVAAAFPASSPADVLIGMFHKLPGVYAQNGVWMMNRNTLGAMRQWKDGQGRYLVIDPISEGAATTLLGRPIVEVVDMPDVAANAYPIVFGDFSGYRIVDRVGFATLRDPYTLAAKGQTRFHARKRVGADVTHPDRFIKLKVSA